MLQVNKVPIPEKQTTNNLFKNLFKFNWHLKSHIEHRRYGEEEKQKQSAKPSRNIQDIPSRLLKEIISHTYVITDTKYILSLRQVCRNWNITINHILYDEISKYSPELTLWMRCQSHVGKIIDFEFPLQQDGLTNRCKVEFFPRVDRKLELFVDCYKFVDFFLLYSNEEKEFLSKKEEISRKKKEISRFFINSCKFANSSVNSNNVIDLDLAFQYTPFDPITFRVKAISFSPIYLLNLFNVKKENDV